MGKETAEPAKVQFAEEAMPEKAPLASTKSESDEEAMPQEKKKAEMAKQQDTLSLLAGMVMDKGMEDALMEAFKLFDSDGNQFISAAELRNLMTKLGENITDGEVDEMLRAADID